MTTKSDMPEQSTDTQSASHVETPTTFMKVASHRNTVTGCAQKIVEKAELERDEARKERDELKALLLKFGWHNKSCSAIFNYRCKCIVTGQPSRPNSALNLGGVGNEKLN